MDLVVVRWSFVVTGGPSGAECHLGLVLGHLMDLVVRAIFLYMYTYLFVHLYVFFVMYLYKCVLVAFRLVSSRLVSSRLVLSRLLLSRLVLCFQCGGAWRSGIHGDVLDGHTGTS